MKEQPAIIRARHLHDGAPAVVIEVAPIGTTLRDAYVGVSPETLPALRPSVAVGPAGQPPTAEAPFSSRYDLNDAPIPLAVFSTGEDVGEGRAIYLKCEALPERFVFGSKGGEQYTAGPDATKIREVDPNLLVCWMKKAAALQDARQTSPAPIADLHPNAAATFNSRALALTQHLSTSLPPRPHVAGSFPVDVHITPHILVEGSLLEECRSLDEHGFRSISDAAGRLALVGANYVEFRRLAESIQRTEPYRCLVSVHFIEEHLFRRLTEAARAKRNITNYCDELRVSAEEAVQLFEVWIPLETVFIEREFPIGAFICRTMSQQFFVASLNDALARADSDEDRQHLRAYFEGIRTRHQGHAALVITVRAEKGRATELARQAAQESVDVLRLYDPAVFNPRDVSACVLCGSYFAPEELAFLLRDGILASAEKRAVDDDYPHLKLSSAQLAESMVLGLPEWNEVLVKEKRSEFESAGLASVALFTRGATKRDLSDRLVYAFAALESLLLKDEQEPITQNVADRLALVCAGTAEQRLEIVRTTKLTYAARSRFVHHGSSPDDALLVQRFLGVAWQFYVLVVPRALRQFSSKQGFLDRIDRIKYSADPGF